MSTKPTATAVIRFFPDKTVTVELDSLVGVNPRRLERATHLLLREYRGKRAAHNAKRHRLARQKTERAEIQAVEDDTKFHKDEDERLAEAAKEDQTAGEKKLKAAQAAAKKKKAAAKAKKEGEDKTK